MSGGTVPDVSSPYCVILSLVVFALAAFILTIVIKSRRPLPRTSEPGIKPPDPPRKEKRPAGKRLDIRPEMILADRLKLVLEIVDRAPFLKWKQTQNRPEYSAELSPTRAVKLRMFTFGRTRRTVEISLWLPHEILGNELLGRFEQSPWNDELDKLMRMAWDLAVEHCLYDEE